MSSAGKVDGSGYGGTDWATRDLAQIWQAVATQDTGTHYELLTGWRRSYELVLQHLAQVENYRANLAIAWPPEKSVAAAAYLDRLDSLIAHLRDTYSAAVRNYGALSAATGALGQARVKVQAIYQEYAANSVALAEYESQRLPVGKVPVIRAAPPVADGRQEELTRQARTIMYSLSNELNQARTSIVAPVRYMPENTRTFDDDPAVNTTTTAQPLPPKTALPHRPDPAPLDGDTNRHAPSHPISGLDSNATIAALKLNGFPGLPREGQTTPPPGYQALPPYSTSKIPIPSALPTISGQYARPGQLSENRLPINKGAQLPYRPAGVKPSSRILEPGGVIGGAPGIGLVQPVKASPQRVNPIGGVVGSGEQTPLLSQTAARTSGHATNGRSGVGSSDRSSTTSADSTDAWYCAEGGAPILRPGREPLIEPGPAIGLS